MSVPITIPSPGESISEVVIGPWHKKPGEWVQKDDTLVEIETDKVTLEIPAPESGVLQITHEQGAELQVGAVIGTIDEHAQRPDTPAEAPSTDPPSSDPASVAAATNEAAIETAATSDARATSLARRIAADKGVDLGNLHGTGPSGRITKADVLTAVPGADDGPSDHTPQPAPPSGTRQITRQRMSKLRQRVAERLVAAQQTAAMLTTFNEVDMSEVIDLRKRHKASFLETHGVGLGFMSFFVKACVSALQAHPRINAFIDGNEIEFHDYVDMSIAVGTDKGLVVPVLRNAESMSFADIETGIKDLAGRAQAGKLSMDDMTGGTFTISNGGVYGSLNSTPILNPPQSGILGMHRIMNRPIEDPDEPGQIVLRPMMYLALSYDHRIVDGAEAVGFLVHAKTAIERPERMLLGV
jgi:2-oxoglutarate dehydrogenase E2 component (dihydrolipoamide succinyltransferase)